MDQVSALGSGRSGERASMKEPWVEDAHAVQRSRPAHKIGIAIAT